MLPLHVTYLIYSASTLILYILPRFLGGDMRFWHLKEGHKGHGAHGRVGDAGSPSPPRPHTTGAGGCRCHEASAWGGLSPLTLRSLSPGPWGWVEAPGEAAAVRALSARLLGLAADLARDPDPSVYLALRLAGDHDLHGEKQYLARLQDAFQHRYGR